MLIEIHLSLLEQGGDSVASVVGSLTDRGYRLLDLDGGAVRPDRLRRQADVFRVFAIRERPAA